VTNPPEAFKLFALMLYLFCDGSAANELSMKFVQVPYSETNRC
jgi:hypothetical protein